MFNRQPFNRGKFNVSGSLSVGSSGIGLMMLKTIPTQGSRAINASGSSNLSMNSYAGSILIKYGKGSSGIVATSVADGTRVFIVDSNVADMVMATKGDQVLSGESSIDLIDIVLSPGDELVINTCDMTVTINGQNAMEYFSGDSDFFALLNGLNILEYRDGSNERDISLDIIWKDKWL